MEHRGRRGRQLVGLEAASRAAIADGERTAADRGSAVAGPGMLQHVKPIPDLQAAAERLADEFGLQAVFVFGSHGAGTARAGSDVDLALLPGGPIDPVRLRDAGADLAAGWGIGVDLVDLARASPVLRHQVLKRGRPLVVRNRSALGEFLSRALTDYADFKAAVAPIERRRFADARHGR